MFIQIKKMEDNSALQLKEIKELVISLEKRIAALEAEKRQYLVSLSNPVFPFQGNTTTVFTSTPKNSLFGTQNKLSDNTVFSDPSRHYV